ncbi:MAG: type 2 isopentenyl-diphosphate Delta-isomerase [archaeon]
MEFPASSRKNPTVSRKADHIRLALSGISLSKQSNLLECVQIVNNSVPDMSFSEISTSASLLGKAISAPILVSPMSGGSAVGEKLNKAVAEACEKFQLPFGVGSQRVSFEMPRTAGSFQVRKHARNVPIFANLGLAQFTNGQLPPKAAKKAVESIEADGLFIHLNPAQELVQREGDLTFSKSLEKLEEISDEAGVPVFAKEVGFGISGKVARKLVDAGISGIDVAGAGGTDFVKIELSRGGKGLGRALSDWGIPAAASVIECAGLGVPIISSGGLLTGVDVAKSVSLGAWGGGFARPVLHAFSSGGRKGIESFLSGKIDELKAAMFLSGSRNLSDLEKAEKRIFGRLAEWETQIRK